MENEAPYRVQCSLRAAVALDPVASAASTGRRLQDLQESTADLDDNRSAPVRLSFPKLTPLLLDMRR